MCIGRRVRLEQHLCRLKRLHAAAPKDIGTRSDSPLFSLQAQKKFSRPTVDNLHLHACPLAELADDECNLVHRVRRIDDQIRRIENARHRSPLLFCLQVTRKKQPYQNKQNGKAYHGLSFTSYSLPAE